MKNLFSRFLSCLMCASAVLTISACGKSSSSSPAPAAPAANDGSSAVNNNPVNLDRVLCANPIALEEAGLQPITQGEDIPKVHFKLSKMKMYMVWETTKNSFTASANSVDDFAPKVECNGTRNVATENSDKNWTDADGTTHQETSSHSENLSGNFKISEDLDFLRKMPSANQRQIEVKFENGKVVLAESKLIPSSSSSVNSNQGSIPMDRMKVGDNAYLTLRFYSVSPKQFEIRAKIETMDANGESRVEFSSAIYDLI